MFRLFPVIKTRTKTVARNKWYFTNRHSHKENYKEFLDFVIGLRKVTVFPFSLVPRLAIILLPYLETTKYMVF